MSRLYLLDTNMVSYIIRGQSPAARARLLNPQEDEQYCLSVITEAEIRYGLAKRPAATTLKERMEWFLAAIQILGWGRKEANVYGELRAKLEARGISIGNMDLQIAAHAVALGAILVTNDKVFDQIDELKETVNWATDI